MLAFLEDLFSAFDRKGEQLYYVGGFVRDFLEAEMCDAMSPGRRNAQHRQAFFASVLTGKADIDFATSAKPDVTIQILESLRLPVIPIGIEFGTIQTMVPFREKPVDSMSKFQKVEITTFRCSESYKKGSRKPGVVFGQSIEEDLARRDFTINAIAMKQDGKLVDPFGGHQAICEGLLLTPIDPKISFSDDPLRMLRACRFQARGWSLCHLEFDVMKELSEKILEISSERVFEEMSKILMSDKPSRALRVMADTGLLRHAFPELQTVVDFKQNQGKWHSKLVWDHTIQVVENTPPILEVRWAALYHDVAKPQTYSETETGVHFYGHDYKGARVWASAADRLKVSTEFKDHVHFLVENHLLPAQLSNEGAQVVKDSSLRKFAHKCGDKMGNLFLLSLADITSHRPDIVAEKKANCIGLRERIAKLLETVDVAKLKLPKGTGDLICQGLGIKPSRELGDIMKKLHDKLIEGSITLESDFVAEATAIRGENAGT